MKTDEISAEQAIEQGVSPVELRRLASRQFSGKVKPKVTRAATPGETTRPARWRMTALDALGESAEGHNQRVEAWARSVLEDLRNFS